MSTDTATPPAAPAYHSPDQDGLFNEFERISVPMTVGANCAFYLAATAEGFFYGFELYIRSPKNHLKKLPAVGDGPAAGLEHKKRLLLWLIDAHAAKFFSDHKGASKKLAEFRAAVAADKELPETLEPDTEGFDSRPDSEATPAEVEFREEIRTAVAAAGAPVPLERPHFAEIPVGEIEPGHNHRSDRAEADVAEIAESIKAQGLLQPIGVLDMGEDRPAGTKRYKLIFGEGRWLAHKLLKLATIDARIWRGISEGQAAAMALVENLQRHDINAVDEAEGFAELGRLGWPQAKMAAETGKDERTIRKALALLGLPEKVRGMIRKGELSARQGRELATWKDRPEVCECIARAAVRDEISSDALAEDNVPLDALGDLEEEGLLFRVPYAYQDKVSQSGPNYVRVSHSLFCWSEEVFKADKKRIDAEHKAATAAAAKKAGDKLERAKSGHASVPLAEMQKGGIDFVALTDEREIFADYLPAEMIATGIGHNKAEVVVCLKPAELKKLEDKYRTALEWDRELVVKAAKDKALARLQKVKQIGPREMALLVTSATQNGTGYPSLANFKAVGVKEPKGSQIELGYWAKLSVLEQWRVIVGMELETELDYEGARGRDMLRWILEIDKLGLIEESDEARGKLLEKLAAEIWAPAPKAPQDKAAGPTTAAKKKAAKKSRK